MNALENILGENKKRTWIKFFGDCIFRIGLFHRTFVFFWRVFQLLGFSFPPFLRHFPHFSNLSFPKRRFLAAFLFAFSFAGGFSDGFSSCIQNLAYQVACLGQYNAAQTWGGGSDPHDFYTPNMLREYFAKVSGARTKTETFYGVCFDYAQTAYNEIRKNRSWYIQNGMADNQWYIAANSKDNSCIALYDPVSPEKSDFNMNGVPVKEKFRRPLIPHVDSRGKTAKNHAWLWIKRNDGTWFWLDPTWTDNTGYICYGVVQNGREVYLSPDSSLCITSFPAEKLAAATPPAKIYTPPVYPSSSPRPYSPPAHSFDWGLGRIFDVFAGNEDFNKVVLSLGFQIPIDFDGSDFEEIEFSSREGWIFGISTALETSIFHPFVCIFSADFFSMGKEDFYETDSDGHIYDYGKYETHEIYDVIFGFSLGLQFSESLVVYGGCGIGPEGYKKDDFDIRNLKDSICILEYVKKLNFGLRLKIPNDRYIRVDVSRLHDFWVASVYYGIGF